MADKEPCIHEDVCIFYNCGSTSDLCSGCGHYLEESKVTSTNVASHAIGACVSCGSYGDCVYSHLQAVVDGKSCWHQQQAGG